MKNPLRTSLAALLAVLALGGVAGAQTPTSPEAVAEARQRFQRGVDLYEERNYTAAMVEFQRAYELTRNPAVLYNISATHELSGHMVEALDAMLEYERLAPRDAVTARRAEVDAALARIRRSIATLVLRVEAEGLTLLVDGLPRSVSEARTGLRVSAGRHRVTLSAPHYQTREEEFDISGGNSATITEALVPERAFFTVECNVPAAEILVDGNVVGTTPVTSPLPLPEGTHHVVVRRAGYTPYETDVNAVGAGARVRATLSWADNLSPDTSARFRVRANEEHLLAIVDGRRVSAEGRDLVPPGRHVLRVERSDFISEEREVDLPAGQETLVRMWLQPTPAYRDAYMGTVRRARVAGWLTFAVGAVVAGGGAAWFAVNEGTYTQNQTAYNTALRAADMCRTNPGCTTLPTLERARDNAQVEFNNSEYFRYGAIATMAAGGITAIIGVVMLATGPSGSRFDERPLAGRIRLHPELQGSGLSLSF
jgi:tetratricopeptide (TPR) repeat protein